MFSICIGSLDCTVNPVIMLCLICDVFVSPNDFAHDRHFPFEYGFIKSQSKDVCRNNLKCGSH